MPPAADDLSTSLLNYRKRVVKLAQNLARENLQRAQQKMKDYYDQKTKDPVLKLDNVFGFIPRELEKGSPKS